MMKCPLCQKIGVDRYLTAIGRRFQSTVFTCYGLDNKGNVIKPIEDKSRHLFEAIIKQGESLYKEEFPKNTEIRRL